MSDLPPLLTVWTADHARRLRNLVARHRWYRRDAKPDTWVAYIEKQMANLKAYGIETLPTDDRPEGFPKAVASPTDNIKSNTPVAKPDKKPKREPIGGPRPKIGENPNAVKPNGGAGKPLPAPPLPPPPPPPLPVRPTEPEADAEPEEDAEPEAEDEEEDEEDKEPDTASYASEHSNKDEPESDAEDNAAPASAPAKAPRKNNFKTRTCSKCRKPGHQARTCPN